MQRALAKGLAFALKARKLVQGSAWHDKGVGSETYISLEG